MTPAPTKIVLGGTLVLTAAAVGAVEHLRRGESLSTGDAAPLLWLLTGLFALRVAGQVLVALRAPPWLPPMTDWNLTPYRILLPTQLIILVFMAWIDRSFSAGGGPPTRPGESVGLALIVFSALYAGVMAIRYGVRMSSTPSARWFGGTIPIVFHFVLASYLFTLGSFYEGN